MAQTEDTELRDLVIEALEKNGSLAKIRALLRANIFLAFEDECENLKQNETLDKLLLLPEGKRQGTEYTYEGRNNVADKLNINWNDQSGNKPILLTLVNNILNQSQKNIYKQDNKHSHFNRLNRNKNYKADQDCTYIVHEDSNTTTSYSQSDNSSDEKNKLDLRLTLDNSDTDTSSGSLRGNS
ncbi:centrosomal protein 43-like [Melitaea cinxia]|uniref:centrosomal protein 43-like n=1 Tax=Melitaea cinxia TaxID=113334 RepID=UPI001E27456B|nr:centrosomal protein 43-like [Melitaea cinxia]